MNVKEILKLHEMWLNGDPNGVQADLYDVDLSGENFRKANLSKAKLWRVRFDGADFSFANLSGTDLFGAQARKANFSFANLEETYFRCSDLEGANFDWANLTNSNLEFANLYNAKVNLANGLFDSIDFLSDNFEKSQSGYIVYAQFGPTRDLTKKRWQIKQDSIIRARIDFDRRNICGDGIKVAPLQWFRKRNRYKHVVWKCLIEWPWLAGVCVPYGTNGAIRASRIRLLEAIPKSKEC